MLVEYPKVRESIQFLNELTKPLIIIIVIFQLKDECSIDQDAVS